MQIFDKIYCLKACCENFSVSKYLWFLYSVDNIFSKYIEPIFIFGLSYNIYTTYLCSHFVRFDPTHVNCSCEKISVLLVVKQCMHVDITIW